MSAQRSGGGKATVSGSASVSASAGNGWLSGWFNNFSLIRFGGSGAGKGGGGLRTLASAIQAGRNSTGSSTGTVEEMPDVIDEEIIDAEIIDEEPQRAIGSGHEGPGGV